MIPQPVKLGVVQWATSFPLGKSQTRMRPMRLPAASRRLSGLKVTDWTGGVWENDCSSSPVWALKTLTDGSCSAAGSYLYPPHTYCPVTEASSARSDERSVCHDQNL